MTARRQLDLALEGAQDLFLDLVLVEQRHGPLVEGDAPHQVGIDGLEIVAHFVVDLARVHDQRVDLLAEQVADDPRGQVGLLVYEGGCL